MSGLPTGFVLGGPESCLDFRLFWFCRLVRPWATWDTKD